MSEFKVEKPEPKSSFRLVAIAIALLSGRYGLSLEGKVKGKHKGLIDCGQVEKSTPRGHNLLRIKVDGSMPVRLLYMKGMKKRIGKHKQRYKRLNAKCY